MSIQVYKGDILLSEPELAMTQWEKAKGLMFSKQHDVLFHFPEEKRLHFHMVFVFYPIDIVFLDDDHTVVDIKPKFRPFTFYYSKAKSSTVLETYAGFVKDHSIRVGDELSVVHQGEIAVPSDEAPTPPALERKQVFHGTSLGKPRDAKIRQVEPASEGDAQATKKRSAKRSSAKPRSKAAKKPASKPAKAASKKSKSSKPSKTPKRSSKSKGSKSTGSKAAKKPASKPAKAASKKSKPSKTSKRSSAKSPSKAAKPKSRASSGKSSKPSAKKPSPKKPSKTSKRSSAKSSKSASKKPTSKKSASK